MALALLPKGRSSSPTLNRILQCLLPTVLAANLFPLYFWIFTALNVSDDPTRGVPLRSLSAPLPEWWTDAFGGDFADLDRVAARYEASETEAPCLTEKLLDLAVSLPTRAMQHSRPKRAQSIYTYTHDAEVAIHSGTVTPRSHVDMRDLVLTHVNLNIYGLEWVDVDAGCGSACVGCRSMSGSMADVLLSSLVLGSGVGFGLAADIPSSAVDDLCVKGVPDW